jgi:hypothetical protein
VRASVRGPHLVVTDTATIARMIHPAASICLVILVVLIFAAAGVYVAFARDLSAARARLVGHSQTMQSSAGTLEYSVLGDGEPILRFMARVAATIRPST